MLGLLLGECSALLRSFSCERFALLTSQGLRFQSHKGCHIVVWCLLSRKCQRFLTRTSQRSSRCCILSHVWRLLPNVCVCSQDTCTTSLGLHVMSRSMQLTVILRGCPHVCHCQFGRDSHGSWAKVCSNRHCTMQALAHVYQQLPVLFVGLMCHSTQRVHRSFHVPSHSVCCMHACSQERSKRLFDRLGWYKVAVYACAPW